MADDQIDKRSDRTTSPDPEQDHSERRIWWTITAVCVVVFLGVIVLGRPLVEGRLNAARSLDDAVGFIDRSKDNLAKVDSAVQAQDGSTQAAANAETLALIATTRTKLREAVALSKTGYDRLTQDEQERSVLVEATAATRIAVLDAAEQVLSAGGASGGIGMRDYRQAVDNMNRADADLVNQ